MKTEIVIFDYDGTLTKSEKGTNSWFNMWKALDDLKTDEKLYSMFKRGEITHREWFSLIIDHLKEKRVTSSFFKQLAKKTVLIDGVGDLFKMLYENNVEIYVLSSGIKNLIDQTLSGLKKYITDIQGYEILFDKQGVVSAGKNVDFLDEQKDDFIKKIIKTKNVKPEEILFVGNGSNDECVSKTGVQTLCLNPDDTDHENSRIWNAYIFTNNIKDILQFVKD